jgi:hypothetical protein
MYGKRTKTGGLMVTEKNFDDMMNSIVCKLDQLTCDYEDVGDYEMMDDQDLQQRMLNDIDEIQNNLVDLYKSYLPSLDLRNPNGFVFRFTDFYEANAFGATVTKGCVSLVNYRIVVSDRQEVSLLINDMSTLFTKTDDSYDSAHLIC